MYETYFQLSIPGYQVNKLIQLKLKFVVIVLCVKKFQRLFPFFFVFGMILYIIFLNQTKLLFFILSIYKIVFFQNIVVQLILNNF